MTINNDFEPYIKPEDFCIAYIAKLTFPTELGECYIKIYSSNINVAHFHLVNIQFGMDIPIKIFTPEYFSKPLYCLNDIEKKVLYDFLNNTEDNIGHFLAPDDNRTIWEITRDSWDWFSDMHTDYPEKNFYKQCTIPNYLDLKDI